MPACPKCKNDIDHLDVVVKERNLCTYSRGEYSYRESIEFDTEYWKCPLCYAQLDIPPDEESANAFLGWR